MLVGDISFYAALINMHTNMCVFINDYGHTQSLEVEVCRSRVKYDYDTTKDEVRYDSRHYPSLRCDPVYTIEKLTNIKLGLKKILMDDEVDVRGLDYEELTEVHRDYNLAGGWRP